MIDFRILIDFRIGMMRFRQRDQMKLTLAQFKYRMQTFCGVFLLNKKKFKLKKKICRYFHYFVKICKHYAMKCPHANLHFSVSPETPVYGGDKCPPGHVTNLCVWHHRCDSSMSHDWVHKHLTLSRLAVLLKSRQKEGYVCRHLRDALQFMRHGL